MLTFNYRYVIITLVLNKKDLIEVRLTRVAKAKGDDAERDRRISWDNAKYVLYCHESGALS